MQLHGGAQSVLSAELSTGLAQSGLNANTGIGAVWRVEGKALGVGPEGLAVGRQLEIQVRFSQCRPGARPEPEPVL